MVRRALPHPAEDRLFDECRSRCCICAFLNDDWEEKRVQIAHIDRNPHNNAYGNLVFLCHSHHDEYDAVRRQSKGLSPRFLRRLKKRVIDHFRNGKPKPRPRTPPLSLRVDFPIPKGLALDDLLYICLLDQYPAGAWGRSLAISCGAFGHPEDPGSISVTYWMVRAIKRLFPGMDIEEVSLFKKYLLERTKTNGAVGMRRNVGSPIGSAFEIIENRRHTAVSAAFFADHANALNKAFDAIVYVIQNRSPGGAWSAVGDTGDGNADPLTTGYVLRTLLDLERQSVLQRIQFEKSDEFLSTYRHRALSWLYAFLKENRGWWPYKPRDGADSDEVLRRVFVNTVDVLASIPEFPLEGSDFASEHARLMEELAALWRIHKLGIPAGIGCKKPNLTATALFVLACCQSKGLYPDLYTEFAPKFFRKLNDILTVGESDAAGWAVTLKLFAATPSGMQVLPQALDSARALAKQTWTFHIQGQTKKISKILERKAPWVISIATKNILPIQREPP